MQQAILHIKRFFGKQVLKKLLKRSTKRKIKSCNINQANSFGILCVVKEEKDFKKIIGLVKYLKDEFGIRNIKALAFYNKKDNPNFLQSRLGFDFYSIKDLNWFCFPNTITARNFINENFDILLDITDGEFIPQKFVLHYSKSTLKVGTFSVKNKPYLDLMIDFKSKDFQENINQVVSYLDMLNNKKDN
tara:strand:+ start:714 stop:1280 length:567 start_codon:yes stop_codon:yes gene_type:complete